MKKLKEKEKKDETKETQEEELRHTFLHTSMLIHTNMPHTHNCAFTQRLYHTHTYAFTYIRYTHKHFYTQSRFYT